MQAWLKLWWMGKVLLCTAFWPSHRGTLRNITEDAYSDSGLCMQISPVCPVSLLLRACDESDNGEGKAYEAKRE